MLKSYILKRGENLIRNSFKIGIYSRYISLIPSFFILCILLSAALSASMAFAANNPCLPLTNRKPTFQITFNEPSNLSLFKLIGNKGTEQINIAVTIPGMLTTFSEYYEASVNEPLNPAIKDYVLDLTATDQINNKKQYQQCYTYEPKPANLTLIFPELGYSSFKPFTVKIKTDSYAICRYSMAADLYYDNPNPANKMADFNELNFSLEHTLDLNENLFPDEKTIVKLYVKCNTTEGMINQPSKQFDMGIDTSKPIITNIRISPQVTNIISNEPLQTTVIVTLDEAARCKYSLSEISNYSFMADKFDDYNKFSSISSSTINTLTSLNLIDNTEYNLKIACENKAKLVSDTKDFSFKVDTKLADVIVINKPTNIYVSKIPVELEVFTNREANCFISTPPAPADALKATAEKLIHRSDGIRGISAPGKYNYTVNCGFIKPGNANVQREQALTLIYDPQPPEILNFTAINTCMLNELNVQWSAKEPISTITGFLYKIKADTVELFNWTETTKNEVKIDISNYDLQNTSANTKYTIVVAGKDSAGNVDKIGKTSQEIRLSDPFAQECLEKMPPKSNITKEFKEQAAFITIICKDSGSGCNTASYLYNAVNPGTSCSASQKYTMPVKVTNNAVFCWKVSDNAGNTHNGEEKITLNIDTDGDGIPDSIDKCSNTPKSEKADSTGCSESQKDDDNDGIPNNKDICPETIQEAIAAKTINESGCMKDTDEDGMPDYWELKYQFDITDKSDASKNPDLDGANNLQEYLAGTNPLESDIDPEQLPDTDGDGVPDTLDRCPETASGDTVNPSNGCSKKDLDTDGDGMSNECEKKFNLDSEDADDAEEDNDNDGLTNEEECNYENCELELDPNNADSDEDGYNDGKEKNKGTNPCDAEDKPASAMLQYMLLILGILLFFAGTGYLAYKKFVLKKSLGFSGYGSKTSKQYRLGSLGYSQGTKASPSQESKTGVQTRQIFAKKQHTLDEKRRMSLQKIKDERKQGRIKELSRTFSGFGTGESSKEEPEIKKISLPIRKKYRAEAASAAENASHGIAHTYLIHPVKKASDAIKNIVLPEQISTKSKELSAKELTAKEEIRNPVKSEFKKSAEYNKVEELAKSNTSISKLKGMTKLAASTKNIKEIMSTPMTKLKGLLPTGIGSKIENLTRKELPIDQLKKYTITKSDIEKIVVDGKQEKQARKIFDELAVMNKEKNQKAEAFANLSSLMKGQQNVDKKDVFKELPKKLVPETSKEAVAFNKLSNILEGKHVDDGIKELSKLRAKKTSIDYLKMLAGKK